MTRPTPTSETPEPPPEWLHPFTCAYCTGDRDGNRPGWPHREGFEYHMATVHYGLPFEAAALAVEAERRGYKHGYEAAKKEDPRSALRSEAAALAARPALDVPDEAIEWARELVRQGYRDEHIVTFTETGYGLEHPIRCRPNLIGCHLNEWLASNDAPDKEPGRYVMTWPRFPAGWPQYTRLAPQPEEPS